MKEMYGKTDLEKFVCFIKEFVRNPKQYDRIVIRTDFVDAKRGYCTREMFDGSEVIKEHCNEILEIMTSLLLKYDISDCLEGEYGRMILLFVFVFIIVMIKSLLG